MVDAAIVMVENLHKHLEKHTPRDAAERWRTIKAHLSRRKRVMRMRRETWIHNLRDLRIILQPRGDFHRTRAVTRHAHMKRLESTQSELCIERAHHAADGVLHEAQFLCEFR